MPLSLNLRSKSNLPESTQSSPLLSSTHGTMLPQQDQEKQYSYDGSNLSATSSFSSISEQDAANLSQRKRDNSLSRSNSMSARLKELFHKSPQNSTVQLPLNPERALSPKNGLDRLDTGFKATGMSPAGTRSPSSTPVSGPAPSSSIRTPTGSPPLLSQAGSVGSSANSVNTASNVNSNSRLELKKSLSNSDINSSLAKMKIQMPPVIENDLDEVLEELEQKKPPVIRDPATIKEPIKHAPRGRIMGLVKPSSSTEIPVSSRSRSPSIQRDAISPIISTGLPKLVTDKLKTMKYHRDGNLLIFDDPTIPHIHDFSKLKKDPIQTSPSGILSSLLGGKKKEIAQQDHMHDFKLENAISLLPDNYSEELIAFKAKPENYRYNYEDYLYDEPGSDSEYESDSEYDSDEDIDPIIGDAQLEIINKLVEKIEHIDKYKDRASTLKKLRLVDKYGKIQGVVGKGSYGIVKLSVKQLPNKSQRIFAIKELKQKSNENLHHFSNRLTSEFMISSSLTHQSIINTYDLMVDFESHTYLQVMDHVLCGDLFSLVQASNGDGLHPIEADCFFKQALNAISYLHSVGISHNDLKVENLLLTLTGRLKLIDFGTSTPIKCAWENSCSKLSGPQGSEPYCGPEMFCQKDYESRLLDIWSLGVIYLVMINGGYGWKIADPKVDNAYKHYLDSRPQQEGGKGNYEPIESVSGKNKNSKKRVLYAMLEPKPEKRIRLKEIWKSKWVSDIELCDSGKGLDTILY